MKLSGSYQINLSKEKVWEALNNPEILKKIYEVLESHQNNLNAPEDLLQYRDNNGNTDGIDNSLD